MKKILYIVIGVVILAAIGWFAFSKGSVKYGDEAKMASSTEVAGTISPTGEYNNTTYKFTANIPAGFKVRSVNPDLLVIENAKSEGIQISIAPYNDISTLTVDMIKKDIPDMKITEAQEVEVGANYKGVAFKSDNPAFDGASREVWFVFKGNLYQISTYARMDDVLKSIFATWKFY